MESPGVKPIKCEHCNEINAPRALVCALCNAPLRVDGPLPEKKPESRTTASTQNVKSQDVSTPRGTFPVTIVLAASLAVLTLVGGFGYLWWTSDEKRMRDSAYETSTAQIREDEEQRREEERQAKRSRNTVNGVIVRAGDIGEDSFLASAPDTPDMNLLRAVNKNDISRVSALLSEGADVNAQSSRGITGLMIASHRGYLPVVQLLLDKGANPNVGSLAGGRVTTNGNTALMFAAGKGHTDVIKLLLSKGASVDTQASDGGTALFWASTFGQPEAARVLVENGANVNLQAADGGSPLLLATFTGQSGVVRVLLDGKANPNITDRRGNTPLKHAQNQGHSDIAQMLQAAGGR